MPEKLKIMYAVLRDLDSDSEKDEVIEPSVEPVAVVKDEWYDNQSQFETFCSLYDAICSFPSVNGEQISFVREIPHELIDSLNFISECEIDLAIKKLDLLTYGEDIVDKYPLRKTTFKEFFFYYVVRSGLRFETREDYEVLDSVLRANQSKVRLSALLGLTYIDDEISLGKKFPFLSESTRSRYVSCSYMVKYLGKKKFLNIDFYEYYSTEKYLKPYNIAKLLKDSNGLAYYPYKKLEKGKISSTLNYNRLIGILSYIKFLTFSEVYN